ncbi:MAG: DUF1350 family protein [Nostoc sp. JL31]|uniref:DUF1350 family protein n=1 Tax=Nostoc sp. JL31 TaxID=2815395 RepID=UPI0025DAD511|nr:DUF1350 family protein [Nostoc sp. JL31]MBN3890014.1 DUF1350 family protein [Nostoc sp. JL31]
MLQKTELKFRKLSNSQVALHPNPKGVIQFIGSFIFGSFPAWAYKYLHQYLFAQGYSLILYRFPLNPIQFNHWEVSFTLLKEQYLLKTEIIKALKEENQPDDINTYSNPANYLWLGHSLGCKYIILLEISSNEPKRRIEILRKCLDKKYADEAIKQIASIESVQEISKGAIDHLLPTTESVNQFFIKDQSSILLAPEISNTVRILRSGWRISNSLANPNQKQTECLIRSSQELFNLTGVISFNLDDIAEDDVAFMVEQIKHKGFQPYLYKELEGWHFQPLSIHIEDLGQSIVHFFDELKSRRSNR